MDSASGFLRKELDYSFTEPMQTPTKEKEAGGTKPSGLPGIKRRSSQLF
jgi:hypothetical protein